MEQTDESSSLWIIAMFRWLSEANPSCLTLKARQAFGIIGEGFGPNPASNFALELAVPDPIRSPCHLYLLKIHNNSETQRRDLIVSRRPEPE